jgi:sulfite reductase alpha subunit-like flavoprotein
MSKRIKATILYASETGKSETFANKLARLIHRSFFVEVKCMEDYDFDNIVKESLLLIVASTFGNGEAPDNGKVIIKKSFISSVCDIKSYL